MSGPLPSPTRTTRLLHPLLAARALGPVAVAHAVHGLVLFVAVVGATYLAEYSAMRMLVVSVGSVVLFWVAHVYAATLAHPRTADASVRTEVGTMCQEARRALPLLQACVAPAGPLLLAVVGVLTLPLAYAASLVIAIATLAAVGFLALHNRSASLRRCLAAALATGGFGATIIAAETFWH